VFWDEDVVVKCHVKGVWWWGLMTFFLQGVAAEHAGTAKYLGKFLI
jgi:hypothetical protein